MSDPRVVVRPAPARAVVARAEGGRAVVVPTARGRKGEPGSPSSGGLSEAQIRVIARTEAAAAVAAVLDDDPANDPEGAGYDDLPDFRLWFNNALI